MTPREFIRFLELMGYKRATDTDVADDKAEDQADDQEERQEEE